MIGFLGALVAGGGALYALHYFSQDLPDHAVLKNYAPPVMSRVYADDGRILTRFAEQERLFLPIARIPRKLQYAFIAAEDKKFFEHHGLDPVGIARAALHNLKNANKGSLSGGSTITQQVVKNFLLTNEKTYTRKIKEAILAVRVSKTFSKEKILELYLNEIYLGSGAYGVVAASLEYFDKPPEDLRLEEMALLASLPKAPSSINPRKYPERAEQRIDFVIGRMLEDGYINQAEATLALARPLKLAEKKSTSELVNGTYFTDAVREEIISRYSKDTLYEGGLSVWTTLRPDYQRIAEEAIKNGLTAYDRRHGWRGAEAKLDINAENVENTFLNAEYRPSSYGWLPALVTETDNKGAKILLQDGTKGTIPLDMMKWARAYKSVNAQGPAVTRVSQVMQPGDVVYAAFENETENGRFFSLQQIPEVQGSIVAADPFTGRILALVGGFDYALNQYNRAVTAKRQPGSSIKPFVYMTALQEGFLPNSIIVDDEISFPKPGGGFWRPQNTSGRYYGPRTLRYGLEKSLNTMTVRLTDMVGLDPVLKTIKDFGILEKPAPNLSIVLGTSETTLMQMVNAYAMLVNGGERIEPSLIEWIQDRHGDVIMRREREQCPQCVYNPAKDVIPPELPPMPYAERDRVVDPVRAYQAISLMQGVVQRGTSTRAKRLGIPVAGKTGTTNDSYDAWFVGCTPNLVVGVYTGFDNPASLGRKEYGSSVALPIWMEFIDKATEGEPAVPFRRPDGVRLVKVDYDTGRRPSPYGDGKTIYEVFAQGDDPFAQFAGAGTYFNNGYAEDGSVIYSPQYDDRGNFTGDAGAPYDPYAEDGNYNMRVYDNRTGNTPPPPPPPDDVFQGGLY